MVTLPHRRRVLPALLTAAVLAVAAITVLIDIIAVQTGHRRLIWPYQQIATWGRTHPWNTTLVVVIAAVLTAMGVLLIMAASSPANPPSSPWTPVSRTWSPAPPGAAWPAP